MSIPLNDEAFVAITAAMKTRRRTLASSHRQSGTSSSRVIGEIIAESEERVRKFLDTLEEEPGISYRPAVKKAAKANSRRTA